MAEIDDLNITDASNTARFPEGQAPSTVNNGARALEGIVARGIKDALEGNINSTGSAGAYIVAANRTITAYYKARRPKRPPTHPGEIWREDVFPELGLTVAGAARDMGISSFKKLFKAAVPERFDHKYYTGINAKVSTSSLHFFRYEEGIEHWRKLTI